MSKKKAITPKCYLPLLALEKRIIASGLWFDCHDSDGPCKPVGIKEFSDNSPLLVVLCPKDMRKETVRLTDLLGEPDSWEDLKKRGNLVKPNRYLIRKIEKADVFTAVLARVEYHHRCDLNNVRRRKTDLSEGRLVRAALKEYAKTHPGKEGKCKAVMPVKPDEWWFENKKRDEDRLKTSVANLKAVRDIAKGCRTKDWGLAKRGAASFMEPVGFFGDETISFLSSLPPESGLSVETEKSGWKRSYFVIDGVAHRPWADDVNESED